MGLRLAQRSLDGLLRDGCDAFFDCGRPAPLRAQFSRAEYSCLSARAQESKSGGQLPPPQGYKGWTLACDETILLLSLNMATGFTVVLVLNTLWFGVGFRYFSLTPNTAAKLLVPKSECESPLFPTIAASLRFLGGMNLAFATFAVLVLVNGSLFPAPAQRALFASVFSLAHASQFVSNLPVALRGGRVGTSLWPVLSGPMLVIFVVDIALMIANAVLAAILLAS